MAISTDHNSIVEVSTHSLAASRRFREEKSAELQLRKD